MAFFVFLIAFLGGCILCLIVYNRSESQLFETRVQHVREATGYLSRSINADAQRAIAAKPANTAKAYSATKKVLQHFLKNYPDVYRAYTLYLKNGRPLYVVDGGKRARTGDPHHSASVNQPVNGPSVELMRAFYRGKPVVERTPRSSELGSFVSAYYPIKAKTGKVLAVLGVDMRFDGYEEDSTALLGSFYYGLFATGLVSLIISLIAYLFLWFSRREHGNLQAEVLQQRKKLDLTREEMSQALSLSEEATNSLIRTLGRADCIVWDGRAFRSPGRLDWEGNLEFTPSFDWLVSDMENGQKFAEVWNERRNHDDQNVWEKLLGFAFSQKLPTVTTEYRINVTDVHELWFEEKLDFEYEPDGSVSIHGFVRDVTEAKKRNDEIRKLVYYDTVTGLINRARIHEVINELLVTNPTISVVGIEIGNFKNINESWGADIADKLLLEFGSQLVEAVGSNGIVGRPGGDDFTIIVPDQYTLPGLVEVVSSICQKQTMVNGVEIPKDCRLGFVTATENETAISIHRKVGLALEYARKGADATPVCYKPEMSFKSKMRVELETSMRQALTDGEFYLMFQPIYCNKTKKLVKAEALLRWNSSRFGPISPGTFIPIAEETDFINDLGQFVIDEAAKTVRDYIA